MNTVETKSHMLSSRIRVINVADTARKLLEHGDGWNSNAELLHVMLSAKSDLPSNTAIWRIFFNGYVIHITYTVGNDFVGDRDSMNRCYFIQIFIALPTRPKRSHSTSGHQAGCAGPPKIYSYVINTAA
jgi:hypothetical protein